MNRYITVKPCGGAAGIGHQFTNFLVPSVLSKKYNLKFVYQPFVGDTDGTFSPKGSNFYQITQPVKLWNDFLNFGEGELTLNDLPKRLSEIQIPTISQGQVAWDHSQFKNYLEMDFKFNNSNVLFKVGENGDGQFIDIDWDFYRNNDLKKKYNNSKQVKNFKCYFEKKYINIAIHIRRGDVTKEHGYRRWMNLNYYLTIIENINKIKFNKPVIYHIYAWDMPQEEKNVLLSYEQFDKISVKLHIDEDVFSTFYHFTKADIFVSGQGALSLLANYLTDAIKLTTPWPEFVNDRRIVYWDNFPSNIEDLIPIDNGVFDTDKLLVALKKKGEILIDKEI